MGDAHECVFSVSEVPGGTCSASLKSGTRESVENPELLQVSSEIPDPRETGMVYKDQMMQSQEISISGYESSGNVHVLESCTDMSTERSVTEPPDCVGGVGNNVDIIVKTADIGYDLLNSHANSEHMNSKAGFVETSKQQWSSVHNVCKPCLLSSGTTQQQYEGFTKDASGHGQERLYDSLQENIACCGNVDNFDVDAEERDLYPFKGRLEHGLNLALSGGGLVQLSRNVSANGATPKNQFPDAHGEMNSRSLESMVLPPPWKNKKSASMGCCVLPTNKSEFVSAASHAEDLCKALTIDKENPSLLRRDTKSNCPMDGPKSCLEQQRKEQLKKSIAQLEAQTLEALRSIQNGRSCPCLKEACW